MSKVFSFSTEIFWKNTEVTSAAYYINCSQAPRQGRNELARLAKEIELRPNIWKFRGTGIDINQDLHRDCKPLARVKPRLAFVVTRGRQEQPSASISQALNKSAVIS